MDSAGAECAVGLDKRALQGAMELITHACSTTRGSRRSRVTRVAEGDGSELVRDVARLNLDKLR